MVLTFKEKYPYVCVGTLVSMRITAFWNTKTKKVHNGIEFDEEVHENYHRCREMATIIKKHFFCCCNIM